MSGGHASPHPPGLEIGGDGGWPPTANGFVSHIAGWDMACADAELHAPFQCSVADIFPAITEERPYRAGMSREKVADVLMEDCAITLSAAMSSRCCSTITNELMLLAIGRAMWRVGATSIRSGIDGDRQATIAGWLPPLPNGRHLRARHRGGTIIIR